MNNGEKQKNYVLAEKLIADQNFTAAVIAGAAATLLAAAAYGITVSTWAFSYGFATAGVGIVIGLSMGFFGRGISSKFTILATVYTVAGCVLGNLFRVMMNLAQGTATSPVDVLRDNSLSALAGQALLNASFVDLVYLLVAAFCAVFLARRPLSRAERLAMGLNELRS